MKFLFVGTNSENTGATTHFVALAQALVQSHHAVDVVACRGGLIERELTQSGVRLHNAMFRNAFDLRGYAKVLGVARQARPDWLVGNFGKEYWPLIIIGRLLQIPVALFRHRTPPMKRLSNYCLPRLAQRFFAVSNHARKAYLDRGVPPERVRVLYNPVNMALCEHDPGQRQAILRKLGIDEGAIVLGYCGRMHEGKGIFTLFDAVTAAMHDEPRLHCLWLGDGPDAPALRERAAGNPNAHRHHFPGWINEIHPWYSAMSMLAFPSIAPETFGRVSVEAQASGIPVLASGVGGIPETLDPGVTGLLLPPGKVDAWHAAIVQMCDASRRLPMGIAAREFVREHFGLEIIANDFVKILVNPSPVSTVSVSEPPRPFPKRHLPN